MTELGRLCFLIHGFCYAEMAREGPLNRRDSHFKDYLDYEARCSERWRQAVLDLPEDDALVILPWEHAAEGPAAELEEFAADELGDRCFILDSTRCHDPSFWEGKSADFMTGVLRDVKDAFLGQGYDWNKEELDTALHSRAAADTLVKMMADRGLSVDARAVQAEAWGASFEGCVTKYSCSLRRLLGLSYAIEIELDKCVPDTYFLLRVTRWERIVLGEDLRLFLFDVEGRTVGLFVGTSQSLADRATYVDLPVDPEATIVVTKWDGRLWPAQAEEKTPKRGIGFYEPAQELVKVVGGRLRVPVSAGMAYRLAKAPAYIFAPPDISFDQFRSLRFS